jgi:hypothetical protein
MSFWGRIREDMEKAGTLPPQRQSEQSSRGDSDAVIEPGTSAKGDPVLLTLLRVMPTKGVH